MHVTSDSALYAISHRPTSHCTALWLCVYRLQYMVMVTVAWWCTPDRYRISICLRSLSKSTTVIMQKIRQLSRNGICCMIVLFLISISACDFHLLFAMKLSVCFYRPWAPPYLIIFRSHAKATENASTSLRRASQKLCALGKHFRWTFSGGVVRPSAYVMGSNVNLGSFGVTGVKRSFSLKML